MCYVFESNKLSHILINKVKKLKYKLVYIQNNYLIRRFSFKLLHDLV